MSACRKTSLSSTSSTRIGWVPASTAGPYGLFGGEEQRVVRLPARLDVELDGRMLLLDPAQERAQLGLVGPGEQRQHRPAVAEQPLRDGVGDVVEIGRGGDGGAVGEAEPGALANLDAVEVDVSGCERHLAGRDLLQRLEHRGLV